MSKPTDWPAEHINSWPAEHITGLQQHYDIPGLQMESSDLAELSASTWWIGGEESRTAFVHNPAASWMEDALQAQHHLPYEAIVDWPGNEVPNGGLSGFFATAWRQAAEIDRSERTRSAADFHGAPIEFGAAAEHVLVGHALLPGLQALDDSYDEGEDEQLLPLPDDNRQLDNLAAHFYEESTDSDEPSDHHSIHEDFIDQDSDLSIATTIQENSPSFQREVPGLSPARSRHGSPGATDHSQITHIPLISRPLMQSHQTTRSAPTWQERKLACENVLNLCKLNLSAACIKRRLQTSGMDLKSPHSALTFTKGLCETCGTPRKMETDSNMAPGLLVWIPGRMRGKGVSTIRGDLHRM